MNRRRPDSISLLMLSANQRVAVTISESVCNDHDKVNQCPDPAASQCQQLRYADAGFFSVEAMHAQAPQEKTQE